MRSRTRYCRSLRIANHAAIIAVLAPLMVAAVAFSHTEATKLSVVTVTKSSHPSGHGVATKGMLVEPKERNEVIGHYHAHFTPSGHRVRARIVFYLAGGSLRIKGTFGAGDNRLAIVGGTGRWDGARGNAKLYNAGHGAERYSLSVIQP